MYVRGLNRWENRNDRFGCRYYCHLHLSSPVRPTNVVFPDSTILVKVRCLEFTMFLFCSFGSVGGFVRFPEDSSLYVRDFVRWRTGVRGCFERKGSLARVGEMATDCPKTRVRTVDAIKRRKTQWVDPDGKSRWVVLRTRFKKRTITNTSWVGVGRQLTWGTVTIELWDCPSSLPDSNKVKRKGEILFNRTWPTVLWLDKVYVLNPTVDTVRVTVINRTEC